MKYNQLLKNIESNFKKNDRLKEACTSFIKYILNNDPSLTDYLSFDILSQITKEKDYNNILSLTQYFTNPKINILQLKFHYFSPEKGSSEPEEIDVEYVHNALENNVFYDPNTGERDPKYKEHLKVFYVLTDSARKGILKQWLPIMRERIIENSVN